jgi:hypothetical protein
MARRKGWALRSYTLTRRGREREVRIVYPRSDARRHRVHPLTTRQCWCKPSVERVARNTILVGHHAADGRELVEQHGVN